MEVAAAGNFATERSTFVNVHAQQKERLALNIGVRVVLNSLVVH